MNTQEHTGSQEAAADGDSSLDQYPVEVLEAVLKILKAQHEDSTTTRQRQ